MYQCRYKSLFYIEIYQKHLSLTLQFPYLNAKEQTKLIAQGIEKGIAQYKKQQKERNRQADKAKKKQQREKLRQHEEDVIESDNITDDTPNHFSSKLPWALLALSWIGFAAYIMLGR